MNALSLYGTDKATIITFCDLKYHAIKPKIVISKTWRNFPHQCKLTYHEQQRNFDRVRKLQEENT